MFNNIFNPLTSILCGLIISMLIAYEIKAISSSELLPILKFKIDMEVKSSILMFLLRDNIEYIRPLMFNPCCCYGFRSVRLRERNREALQYIRKPLVFGGLVTPFDLGFLAAAAALRLSSVAEYSPSDSVSGGS